MDLVLLPDQMPLDLEKHALTRADGAPDCHRSRRDRTVRFAKLDRPVLSHRHVILSRGTQRNRQKNVGVLKLSKSFCFVAIFVWSDISIGFQNRGTASRSDISDPISDISDVSDISESRWVPIL
jgi:uncharacterized protein (DUF2461 family)